MSERKTWVIAHNEDLIGRLDVDEIKAKRDGGELDGTAVAWEPGTDEWRAVHDIPELLHLFPKPMELELSIPHWKPSSLSDLDPHHHVPEPEEPEEPALPHDLPAIEPQHPRQRDSLRRPPSLPWIATDASRPLARPGFLIVALAALVLFGFHLVTQRVLGPRVLPAAPLSDLQLDLEPVVEEGEAEEPAPVPRRRVARPRVFDSDAIIAGVRAHSDDLDECLVAARAAQELAPGSLVLELSWVVDADGGAQSPRLTGPFNVLKTSVPGCVANRMGGWRFSPAPGREVAVNGFQVKMQVY